MKKEDYERKINRKEYEQNIEREEYEPNIESELFKCMFVIALIAIAAVIYTYYFP